MRYTADREGHKWQESTGQDKLLEKLYGSAVGRCILRPLVSPVVSKLGGRILDSRISVLAVEPFIRRNGINREDYEEKEYSSYNLVLLQNLPYENNFYSFIFLDNI